jgi:predicted glycoside hydrolase/deacetylase ChbG (UPF0249 family)
VSGSALIVNVDDLGLHPAVSRAVRRLARLGVVTSASLLANGPNFEEAARSPAVPTGVHLNLLRGRPILPPPAVRSLVDERGLLLGSYRRLLARHVRGGLRLDEIEREWDAQIARVRDIGVVPSHLDSEKHVHAWPRLMPIVQRLARRHSIGWIRRPVERLRFTGLPPMAILRIALLAWFGLFHRPAAEVRWPDSTWGIADQGSLLRPARFARYVSSLDRRGVLEIVCHPGLPQAEDPPLPEEVGRLRVAGQWLEEFRALSDSSWLDTVRELGLVLVSYESIRSTGEKG